MQKCFIIIEGCKVAANENQWKYRSKKKHYKMFKIIIDVQAHECDFDEKILKSLMFY